MALAVIPKDRITAVLREKDILEATRQALIAQAEGHVKAPPPGQLMFEAANGDCHIKYGAIQGADTFAIKVATGFYDNPGQGLPVTCGLILVMDARTGRPLLLLDDEGWLTNMRTAAAGALAAHAAAPAQISALGIIGAGEQAYLQARWTARLMGIENIHVWARRPEQAGALSQQLSQEGFQAKASPNTADLLQSCNLVITCTPAKAPLFPASEVRPGSHIVAMGADSPGKQELDPTLFARADTVLCDSLDQCLDHGDFGHAVRAGHVPETKATELGHILSRQTAGRTAPDQITIADLTGLAAQDIAMADLVRARLPDQ
ncbi:ornithine cyclodeaminase [Aestuariispira insulae]|uniref:Ornithine cyclodeaminase n=1 Tax=Aestuariispira insulae TaxID=1461337 RepID=A0A3D9HRS2_9PROT|nr:ornithine cyclodeaminase [Aestuariispira insulae]RED52197.1 ornithine cyclodeaminase [Aestuariispira insulae]